MYILNSCVLQGTVHEIHPLTDSSDLEIERIALVQMGTSENEW